MQNGYVKGRSTNRAIYQVLEDIENGINRNSQSLGIFMDLTKAFDSIIFLWIVSRVLAYWASH